MRQIELVQIIDNVFCGSQTIVAFVKGVGRHSPLRRSHGSFVPMYDISSVSRFSISDTSLISNVQSSMSILFCFLTPVKQFDCAFFISKGIHVGFV